MPLLLALSVSIGLLAIVATWLFLGPLAALHVQIWQAFVAWASHYHNGGKSAGLTKALVCRVFGALVGMGSVMLAGQLGALGALAAPVAVGIGAALIVLAAHLPMLSTIPSSVYGFACVAGLMRLSPKGRNFCSRRFMPSGLPPVGAVPFHTKRGLPR